MSIAALGLGALSCICGVLLTSFPERFDFGLSRVLGPEGLDEINHLFRYCPDCLGSAMQEHLGHGGFIKRRRHAVDGASEPKNGIGIDIASEAQNCVAIHTSVLEVDASTSVLTNNDLKLVVPSVGASANLNTLLNLTSTAKHVLAEGCGICRFRIVQAKNKKSSVYNTERVCVVGAWLTGQNISKAGPDLTVLSTQYS
ncbi:hypothetical protein HG531_001877 [Fusarium graminearum]|nr:hypothetical protein HG531_001877 [Fusarium graminearum]